VVTTQRDRAPAIWWALWLAAAFVVVFAVVTVPTVGVGYDSHAYWLSAREAGDPYTRAPLVRDAFLYSPLFRQLVWPLAQLPWVVFGVAWSALVAFAFLWLLRPLPWSLRVPALLACGFEVVCGNITAFMAVAIILGVTRGSPWLLSGLTKVAPGVVGVVWHTARGDWIALRKGAGVGLALVALSWLAAPEAWPAWIGLVRHAGSQGSYGSVPRALYAVEVVIALPLLVFGARTGRPWTLVVATLLLSPTASINTFTLLAALPRLRHEQHGLRAGSGAPRSAHRAPA
jgi:hypothetical protein